jgi:hypothetical protein
MAADLMVAMVKEELYRNWSVAGGLGRWLLVVGVLPTAYDQRLATSG